MRLRGRDLHGISYDIAFTDADFRRCGGRLVIGRNHDLSQLHLSHDSVSRQHATLTWQDGSVHVEDRNSGNGTKVNGRELMVGSPPTPLRSGDKLSLGEVDLMFEILN
jgi:pSer/pThr/pTyr-binding forkhead associated (FHA) protein